MEKLLISTHIKKKTPQIILENTVNIISINLFVFFSFIGYSQIAIQNQVLATSGNSLTVGNTTIDFTFGEPFTSTFPIGSNNFITQGFQQPMRKKLIIDVSDSSLFIDEIDEFNISSYPNPFNNYLTVELSELKELSVEIFDMNGREIRKVTLLDLATTLDLSDLQSGNYKLIILDGLDNLKTYSIIKTN